MDFLTKNQTEINKFNTEVKNLTDFEKKDNPYNEFVPAKYGRSQQDIAESSVNKAIYENKLIGYALKNSKAFNLDSCRPYGASHDG